MHDDVPKTYQVSNINPPHHEFWNNSVKFTALEMQYFARSTNTLLSCA